MNKSFTLLLVVLVAYFAGIASASSLEVLGSIATENITANFNQAHAQDQAF